MAFLTVFLGTSRSAFEHDFVHFRFRHLVRERGFRTSRRVTFRFLAGDRVLPLAEVHDPVVLQLRRRATGGFGDRVLGGVTAEPVARGDRHQREFVSVFFFFFPTAGQRIGLGGANRRDFLAGGLERLDLGLDGSAVIVDQAVDFRVLGKDRGGQLFGFRRVPVGDRPFFAADRFDQFDARVFFHHFGDRFGGVGADGVAGGPTLVEELAFATHLFDDPFGPFATGTLGVPIDVLGPVGAFGAARVGGPGDDGDVVLHRLAHRRDLGAVARVRDDDDRVGALRDHALDPRDGLLRFEVGVDDDFLFDRRAFFGDHLDLFLGFFRPVVQAATVLDAQGDAFFAAPRLGAGRGGFGAAFFFGFAAAAFFGFG